MEQKWIHQNFRTIVSLRYDTSVPTMTIHLNRTQNKWNSSTPRIISYQSMRLYVGSTRFKLNLDIFVVVPFLIIIYHYVLSPPISPLKMCHVMVDVKRWNVTKMPCPHSDNVRRLHSISTNTVNTFNSFWPPINYWNSKPLCGLYSVHVYNVSMYDILWTEQCRTLCCYWYFIKDDVPRPPTMMTMTMMILLYYYML